MKKGKFLLILLSSLIISSCGGDDDTISLSSEEILTTELNKGSASLTYDNELIRSFSSSDLNTISALQSEDGIYTLSATNISSDFTETVFISISILKLPAASGDYTLGEIEGIVSFQVTSGFTTIFLGSLIGWDQVGSEANKQIPINITYLSNGIRVSFDSPTSVLDGGPSSAGFIEATQ